MFCLSAWNKSTDLVREPKSDKRRSRSAKSKEKSQSWRWSILDQQLSPDKKKEGEASFSGLPYAKQWMARQSIDRFIQNVNENDADVNAPSPSKSILVQQDVPFRSSASRLPRSPRSTPATSAGSLGLWSAEMNPRPISMRAVSSRDEGTPPDTVRSAASTSSTGVYAARSNLSTGMYPASARSSALDSSKPSALQSSQGNHDHDAELRLLEARAVLNIPGAACVHV